MQYGFSLLQIKQWTLLSGPLTPPFAYNRGQKQKKANNVFPYLEYAYSYF